MISDSPTNTLLQHHFSDIAKTTRNFDTFEQPSFFPKNFRRLTNSVLLLSSNPLSKPHSVFGSLSHYSSLATTYRQRRLLFYNMDYSMEDTQNSAPGAPSAHEAAKLSPAPRRQDAQSVTKRYNILLTIQRLDIPLQKLIIILSCRLQSELMTLMLSAPPGISAFPSSTSLLVWTATLLGPADTPYADLTFKLKFEFSSNYPYSPPTVLFKTPIYHPNVDFSGRICLDILQEKWSAVLNVQSVLLSLQSLLGEPNK